jgi:hypothetical protein
MGTNKKKKKKENGVRHWWPTPEILTTQGAEIRRRTVQSQHRHSS